MIFVKEMQLKKLGGVYCKIGGMGMSPLANGGRPWKREEMKGINGEGCGVLDIWRRRYFGKLVEGKKERKRKKEKGKEFVKEKIFS